MTSLLLQSYSESTGLTSKISLIALNSVQSIQHAPFSLNMCCLAAYFLILFLYSLRSWTVEAFIELDGNSYQLNSLMFGFIWICNFNPVQLNWVIIQRIKMIFIGIRYELHLLCFRTSDMKWQKTYIVTPPMMCFLINLFFIFSFWKSIWFSFCFVRFRLWFISCNLMKILLWVYIQKSCSPLKVSWFRYSLAPAVSWIVTLLGYL